MSRFKRIFREVGITCLYAATMFPLLIVSCAVIIGFIGLPVYLAVNYGLRFLFLYIPELVVLIMMYALLMYLEEK